jgi:hypothetical protein
MNPIESLWTIWKPKCRLAHMQHCVASKTSLSAIERIAKEQFDSVPVEHGQHAFKHFFASLVVLRKQSDGARGD